MSHFFVNKCHVVVAVCLHSGTGLKVQKSIPNWNAESFSLQGLIFCFQDFMWWSCVFGVGCICLIDKIVTVSVTSIRMFVQFIFSGVFVIVLCWGWGAMLLRFLLCEGWVCVWIFFLFFPLRSFECGVCQIITPVNISCECVESIRWTLLVWEVLRESCLLVCWDWCVNGPLWRVGMQDACHWLACAPRLLNEKRREKGGLLQR